MRNYRIGRKKAWNDRGVTEVLGTILTLTITVVLFSSIMIMVNKLPSPGDNAFTRFGGTVNPVYGDWTQGAYVNVTCMGGAPMIYEYTDVILTVDDTTYVLENRGQLSGTPYGIGGNDTDWDVSETWSFRLAAGMVNSTSKIGMVIVDNDKDMVVWSGVLYGGEQDLAPITTDAWADVELETTRHDPIRFGQDFYFFAEVSDPNDDLNTNAVWVDMSSIGLEKRVNLTDPDLDGTFEVSKTMGPAIPVGYYPLVVHATDLRNHSSTRSFLIPVGQEIGFVPNLAIQMDNIALSDYSPLHGDTIKIEAIVQNFGLKSTWADIYFYDGDETGKLIGQEDILISGAPDEVTTSIYWRAAPGGNHTLTVVAVARDDVEPVSLRNDNSNYTNVSVLPTILLVDDDAHVNDGSDGDTVRFMRSAMSSCGFSYDFVQVPTGSDGPAYDYGDYQLENYDIVVWMTGYQTVNTLKANDQTNLIKYLTYVDVNRSNTGSLWLISDGVFQDPGVPNSFIQNYLRIISVNSAPAPVADIWGIAGHIVTNEWSIAGASGSFEIMERVPGETDIFEVNPFADAEDMFLLSGNPVAMNYENSTIDERIVVTPWEFSRVDDAGDQTQIAFKTILWLGNITSVLGTDLAISGQNIRPSKVFFGETVNISATVRNNGPDTLYGVEIQMFIDDVAVEKPGKSPIQIDIPGHGSSRLVSLEMKAEHVGDHIIKWKVDPNDMIVETNEDNNEVSDYLNAASLTVEFRILVIDDDESLNNGGAQTNNDTASVADSLMDLGYIFENYTIMLNMDGPDVDMLSNYSAILWVTGNASDASALTGIDQSNVQTYMTTVNGYFWLIGSNCLGDTLETFEEDFLLVSSLTMNQPLPATLEGVEDNVITHGMRLQTDGQATADTITPDVGATGILTDGSNIYTIMSETYRSVVTTFSFSNLTDENERNEFMYLVFHWFNKPDIRPELRITPLDFKISQPNPILGEAYILTANVRNVGGVDSNVLVRFMDGDTLIGSDSVSIAPDGQTSAEVIWRPLFAGQRTIEVQVDPGVTAAPLGEVDEIFDIFNNYVNVSTYVYYFWDDMEDPTLSAERWSHSATIININGESPLDFMTSAYGELDTDIQSNWSADSYGVERVTDVYHSYESSYHMEEPTGAFGPPSDVLCSIVIDNSVSMTARTNATGANWLEVAKDAAKHLVSGMTDDSAVSIFAFKGNGVETILLTTPLVGAGRTIVNNAIDGIMDAQMTPIWDATGVGYMEVKTNMPAYPNLTPAVIVLSDGADYKSNDQSAFGPAQTQKLEAASQEWAPWHNMQPELGYPQVNYPAGHKGKYAIPYTEYGPGGSISPNGRWWTSGGGSYNPLRKGLLTSDVPIYTIGLALEHFDPVWEPVTAAEPPEGTVDTNAVWSGGIEAGTTEYNLWRISNTSEAEYFYSPDSDDLEDIFEEIGRLIGVTGFNQTRAGAETLTRAEDSGEQTRAANSDKRAVTEAFSMDGMDSVTLSFWHKYNMLQGGNGGFLQVAYKTTAGGPWRYKYITPPGEYTGGLYYPVDVYDDFGNLIKWCWNGISGGGTFGWDYVSVDILDFVPEAYRSEVRVAFNYTQFGGGTGYGWWIDDVKVKVSRTDGYALDDQMRDVWNLTNMTQLGLSAHSGDYCWMNRNVTTNYTKEGIDNSLVTMPIDLTRADTVTLSAYLKFNINTADGAPPDGFRVEVSKDGQKSWSVINLGARAAWGVSGTGADADDGNASDGKTYTGLDPDGDGWVEAGTMTRLSVDMTPFRGHQIHIRFRMVTNSNTGYLHYDDPLEQGGFFLDDVKVMGETI